MTSLIEVSPFPLGLTAPEGDAVGVLDALLGLARPEAMRAAALPTVRSELLLAGASRIRVGVLRYLVEEGGFRERQVLRNGRRVLGRAWSPALGAGLRLSYTEATSKLWIEAAKYLPSFAQTSLRTAPQQASEGERKHKRILRDMVLSTGTDTGDWVFYAMVHRSLAGFRLISEDHQQMTRKLRQGSPLAALMELDGEGTEPELRARFRPLCRLPAARLIECLEDRISEGWSSAVTLAWNRSTPTEGRIARFSAVARVLGAWVGAIDESRRMDLARPVMKLFRALGVGVFSKGGDSVRAEILGNGWIKNVKEREDLLAAVASVVAVGQDLFRRRDVLATERYGDERYDEAQIYLRDVAELLTPSRRVLEGVSRALSSTLG